MPGYQRQCHLDLQGGICRVKEFGVEVGGEEMELEARSPGCRRAEPVLLVDPDTVASKLGLAESLVKDAFSC